MSYLRWICAMHFAKLARRGNSFVEIVNAFRLHRQQKTAACEAAAQARAEFWTRFTDNLRRIRAGQFNYVLRRTIQPQRLEHANRNNANFRESGAEGKTVEGSFHTAAKKEIVDTKLREVEGNTATQKIIALSTLLRNSIREKGEALGELLQQTKQKITCLPQLSQTQRNLSITNKHNNNNKVQTVVTATQKSLAMCTVPKSCVTREGATANELQKTSTQQTNQNSNNTTTKPTTSKPFLFVQPTAPDKPTFTTQLPVPTMQMCESTFGTAQTKPAALFLPEKPNILVLPEMNAPHKHLQEFATNTYAELEDTKSIKLLNAPANTLKSTPQCKISTEPPNCILPPQTDNPMTLCITNVLDKYKIISLPAGRPIPGQPKRHVQIPTRKRSPSQASSHTDLKRKKY